MSSFPKRCMRRAIKELPQTLPFLFVMAFRDQAGMLRRDVRRQTWNSEPGEANREQGDNGLFVPVVKGGVRWPKEVLSDRRRRSRK